MSGRRFLCVVVAVLVGAAPSMVAGPALAASNPTLSVSVSGQGSVTSGDGQIDCPKLCTTTNYKPGTTVVLTAQPVEGWSLYGWSGDCTGRVLECKLTITGDTSVKASFVYSGLGDPGAVGAGDLLADGGPAGTTSVKLRALADNRPPKAVLTAPAKVKAGASVQLNAAKSSDPDGHIAGYRWDLNGDGVYDDGFGPQVTFSSLTVGNHVVRLEVADNDARVVAAARTIRVTKNMHLPTTTQHLKDDGTTQRLHGGFDTLAGWHRFGTAFASPIVKQSWISASRVIDANGRLNGSYSDGVHVNEGATGAWASSYRPSKIGGLSANAAAAMATGELVSHPFVITKKYLSFSLGGGGVDTSAERVEVWVQLAKSQWRRVDSTSSEGSGEVLRPAAVDLSKYKKRRAAIVLIDNATTAWLNVDNIRQANTRPRRAADSSYFHVAPTARGRYVPPAPIVGFADFHAHPTAAQGFGALQGTRAYMGTVGGNVATYDSDPTAFAHDVYGDDVYHYGGPLAKFGIDLAEGRVDRSDTGAALDSLVGSHAHPRFGGACNSTISAANRACADPTHQPGTIGPAHEQMNVFEIHRAWEGGLRLLSSLAINSSVLEYLGGYPLKYDGTGPETDIFGAPTEHNGDQSVNQVAITPENKVIAAEVEGMRELAGLNSSWMQIAYNPQQAYDIASSGKLAIVLGTEIDTTGRLGFGSPQAEVDWLWGQGIRQVTPIHCCDSRIGGSALFQDAYNTANDFQNRPTKDITAIRAGDDYNDQGLAIAPKPGASSSPQVGYFLHAVSGCQYPDNVRGECINWRFDSINGTGTVDSPNGRQSVAVIDGNALTALSGVGFTVHPAPYDRFPAEAYHYYDAVSGGMRNPRGLTDYGRTYIEALMNRGMLIDMEHMSEQTIDDLVDPGTAAGHTRGPVWAFDPGPTCSVTANFTITPRPGDCWSYAYPLMSSHTSFRAQSLAPGSQTLFKGFVSREFERSSNQIEYIRRSGGVLGPVVLQDPVDTITSHVPYSTAPTWQFIDHYDWPTTSHPANSCAGSSESWAQAYLYGLQKMGGQGVGVGTDMLLVGGTAPRFGDSSPAHLGAIYSCDDSRETLNIRQEETVDSSQYQRSAQRNPVSYGGAFASLSPGSSALRPDVDPAGVDKNMNQMGMVAYGELPDLLQDATNVGVTPHDLTPMFSSAQSYVDMWAKAYSLTGCYDSDFARCGATPDPPADRTAVCQGTCPRDFGRGLGIAPNGHPYVVTLPPGIH